MANPIFNKKLSETYVFQLAVLQAVCVLQIIDSQSDVIQKLDRILAAHQALVDELLNCLRDSLLVPSPKYVLRHVVGRILAVELSQHGAGGEDLERKNIFHSLSRRTGLKN